MIFSRVIVKKNLTEDQTVNKKPSSNLFHVYVFVLSFLFLTALLAPLFAQEGREMFVKEYKVGAKDLLEIKVFELPELSQTVRVSEDGSISLPLLGRIEVHGLTKDAVEAKLAGLLEAKYLKNAQVSVFIKEYQSQQVAVIGAVEKPGTYELVGRMSLLQVISQAGGFKENASNEIFVLREGRSGNTAAIAIDLKDLLLNGNQKLNIPLMPSDIINVPVDQIIKVFVFGEVRNPGALQVKMSEKITLLQAIAQAGGPTDGASKSGVVVKRKDAKTGKEIKLKVNLKEIIKGDKPDIVLREGDVVYVPESIF
jgi:polysaccharide export outer membrane protein